MTTTSPEENKALVLQTFDRLFNKRDYVAAERFWSNRYIQHSAHIHPAQRSYSAGPRWLVQSCSRPSRHTPLRKSRDPR